MMAASCTSTKERQGLHNHGVEAELCRKQKVSQLMSWCMRGRLFSERMGAGLSTLPFLGSVLLEPYFISFHGCWNLRELPAQSADPEAEKSRKPKP